MAIQSTHGHVYAAVTSLMGIMLVVLCSLASAPDGIELPNLDFEGVQPESQHRSPTHAHAWTFADGDDWEILDTYVSDADTAARDAADDQAQDTTETEADSQSDVKPAIEGMLADRNGAQTIAAQDMVELVDAVSYRNLMPGVRYELAATLHVVDGSRAEEAHNAPNVIARAKTLFTPARSSGLVEAKLHVDTSKLVGNRIAAVEMLRDSSGRALVERTSLGNSSTSGNTVLIAAASANETAHTTSFSAANSDESASRQPSGTSLLMQALAAEAKSACTLIPFSLVGLGLAWLSVRRLTRNRGPGSPTCELRARAERRTARARRLARRV